MAFLGDDEWAYRPPRPSARHHNSHGYNMNLDPNAYRRDPNGGLHRTRSTGHSPAPIVNVYNDVYQDANLRADNQSPPYAPMPPGSYPVPYPAARPESRGRRDRLGDELADELAEMRIERRMRSRSRGRSDASSRSSDGRGRSEFYKHELDRLEREKREIEQKEAWKREEARIKADMEIKRLKDEANRAANEEKQESEKKRVIEEFERKQREAKERAKAEETRILEKMERDKIAAKEEERRVLEKVEREKREAKEREDREWAEFERRRKEKQEKEEKEKKEAQAKLDDAMRKRLAESGFTQSQIEAIMDKEKAKKQPTKTTTTTTTTTLTRAPLRAHVPTYAKIHIDYLSVETLRYYDIPYEFDRVSDKRDPSQSKIQILKQLTISPERPLLHHHPARNGQARNQHPLRPHQSSARRQATARRSQRKETRVRLLPQARPQQEPCARWRVEEVWHLGVQAMIIRFSIYCAALAFQSIRKALGFACGKKGFSERGVFCYSICSISLHLLYPMSGLPQCGPNWGSKKETSAGFPDCHSHVAPIFGRSSRPRCSHDIGISAKTILLNHTPLLIRHTAQALLTRQTRERSFASWQGWVHATLLLKLVTWLAMEMTRKERLSASKTPVQDLTAQFYDVMLPIAEHETLTPYPRSVKR